MPRNHARSIQIGPDVRQILALYTQQVDPLATCDLDGRDHVFIGSIRNGTQFFRGCDPAPHTRHNAIGAVLLDVGVFAFVDKARLRIVAIFQRPVG